MVLAAELPDPRLVDALDKDAADYGARNDSFVKPLDDRLDLRGRRVEDGVMWFRARWPDLPAVGASRRVNMTTFLLRTFRLEQGRQRGRSGRGEHEELRG